MCNLERAMYCRTFHLPKSEIVSADDFTTVAAGSEYVVIFTLHIHSGSSLHAPPYPVGHAPSGSCLPTYPRTLSMNVNETAKLLLHALLISCMDGCMAVMAGRRRAVP